jgi:hypothetical protein
MCLVALVAVGLAAFRYPSPLAASCIYSAAVATLLATTVAAISLSGRRRHACASATVCGGSYLLLTLGPWFASEGGPHLVTQPLIEIVYQKAAFKGTSRPLAFPGQSYVTTVLPFEFWTEARGSMRVSASQGGTTWPLAQIAHALFGLMAAAAGGFLSLALTRPPREVEAVQDITDHTSDT